jgi:hypothetical protein
MNGSAQIWNSRVFKKTKNEWFRSNLEQSGIQKEQKMNGSAQIWNSQHPVKSGTARTHPVKTGTTRVLPFSIKHFFLLPSFFLFFLFLLFFLSQMLSNQKNFIWGVTYDHKVQLITVLDLSAPSNSPPPCLKPFFKKIDVTEEDQLILAANSLLRINPNNHHLIFHSRKQFRHAQALSKSICFS